MPNHEIEKTFLSFYQCPSVGPLKLTTCCGSYVSHDGTQHVAETHYAGIVTHTNPGEIGGYGWSSNGSGCLYVNSKVRFADITDGTSQTLLVTERIPFADTDPWKPSAGGRCVRAATAKWGRAGRAISRVVTYFGINNPAGTNFEQAGVASSHSGGANFVFADGHVAMLSENIRLSVLWALTTRAPGVTPAGDNPSQTPYGGEAIGDADY